MTPAQTALKKSKAQGAQGYVKALRDIGADPQFVQDAERAAKFVISDEGQKRPVKS